MQRDHWQVVDVCQRPAVDEDVSLLEQHIFETKREVLAAAPPGITGARKAAPT
jgi:hypothetical protein